MSISENELFSFALITYKNFDGIFDTLESLFKQDYPRIELIIADDGSPNYDEEIDAIREYVEDNKGENIVNTVYAHLDKNQGTVRNINNAIKVSNGYYFKALGAGDSLANSITLSRYAKLAHNLL